MGVSGSGFGKGLKAVRGLTFRVLSKQFSPVHIEQVLGTFLASQEAVFEAYTQESLNERVASIVTSLNDPPTSYSDEASTFWPHILEGTDFLWREKLVDALNTLTVEDIRIAAKKWVFDPSIRASVSFMIFGGQSGDSIKQEISTNCAITQSDNKNSFFPYFDSKSVEIIYNLDELRDKKNKLKFFFK